MLLLSLSVAGCGGPKRPDFYDDPEATLLPPPQQPPVIAISATEATETSTDAGLLDNAEQELTDGVPNSAALAREVNSNLAQDLPATPTEQASTVTTATVSQTATGNRVTRQSKTVVNAGGTTTISSQSSSSQPIGVPALKEPPATKALSTTTTSKNTVTSAKPTAAVTTKPAATPSQSP